MSVAAVVVTHGPEPDLPACLAALEPQVEELLVVANPPAPDTEARMIVNERPLGFSANVNRGVAETTAPFVVVANPDTVAEPGAVAMLREFAEAHPRAGIVGPKLVFPDGSLQSSRRRWPTVSGTIVRRTPLRQVLRHTQRAHYGLDHEPSGPVEADWLLGAFLFLRREMLEELGGFDERFRLYGEDIDLAYRAAKVGWERWYVPDAVVRHAHAAVTDRRLLTRRTLWHWRGILRFVRKHPERLRALYPRRMGEEFDSAKVVAELKERAERERAAGGYPDDLSGVELEKPSSIVEGFDLQADGPRVRFRPELGFSSKPVVGPAITLVKRFYLRLLLYVFDDLARQTNTAIERLETALAVEVASRERLQNQLEERISDLKAEIRALRDGAASGDGPSGCGGGDRGAARRR